MTLLTEYIAACPDCDLLQRIGVLPSGATARCPRCGRVVASDKPNSLNRTLALAVAAIIALIVANVTPLMGLSAVGRHASTTILGGIVKMWREGQEITALLVALCSVVAPILYVGFMLVVLLAVRKPPAPRWIGALLRFSELSRPWVMVEVMMLGILVSLVKIADLATVNPGIGMFAVGALIVLLAAMTVSFDPREAWARIAWVDEPPRKGRSEAQDEPVRKGGGAGTEPTGRRMGLAACGACGLLARAAGRNDPGSCPRCGEILVLRRPGAIQRTWAFLIAASICYLPANLLPVMNTAMPGYAEADTIMSGVILLYESGSWPLALIVFVASIMIPLAKIIALAYLLVTVQFRRIESRPERIRVYRIIEVVGRWSMLDVFVVTFVVALVQLQPLMSVEPGAGVVFFAAVVVLTMLAAESFDPRLIWDENESEEDRKHD
ncbi:MAG: paraquat-inducible protein A [Smithellaceae bacterium]|nr:paraquat-inducible protein A [Smithellaceae bacterium]NLX51068.1 paraquat-inducible protein A [Deltaproteobacteria bacterium]